MLVPGGVANSGMVPPDAGYDSAEMIKPAVTAPPLSWLVSDATGNETGRRFLAVHRDLMGRPNIGPRARRQAAPMS